ncbi:hypothetical protein ZIOFF_073684 [Zingiber officinale]|uniref:Protein kinase domain-containing protein n=1 Tax=Zingiber officinale TaxID=94328 RepID=A0A8J5ESU8_ZINOF|nr:hypothetical protein ZIOFF_073684 [Zingiber officinale]
MWELILVRSSSPMSSKILLGLLILFLVEERSAIEALPRYEDCAPRTCGKHLVQYPFSLTEQNHSFCGPPPFALSCAGSILTLTFFRFSFNVVNIFYNNNSIQLTFGDYDPCILLLSDHTNLPDRNCNNYTIMPVMSYSNLSASSDYHPLLRTGWLSNWIAPACAACNNSGGRCGYDSSMAKFICICHDGIDTSRCGGKNSRWKLAAGLAGSAGFIALACAIIFLLCKLRKSQNKSASSKSLSRNYSLKDTSMSDHFQIHVFSFEELLEATDCFHPSRELGDGGFGTVYKGELRDGRTVAIKRLYGKNYKRVEVFMNEVKILSHLRHQNLVSLYGCTSQHSHELLLVYEFIPNGTLADHLHGSRATERILTWSMRLNIAIEIADALAYLHAVPIMHRDVKTTNILLDCSFHVKVADFGLSRLFPTDATHVSTAPQGTPGYVDPEYHRCFQLTDKSDVYSFGVVLVELISSKPAIDIERERSEINLANMAITKIQNHEMVKLVDPELWYQSDELTRRMITMVAELAFKCLQPAGDMRPTFKEVLQVLKAIKSATSKSEKKDMDAVVTQDDACLVPNIEVCSPDTVAGKWVSQDTTPNNSM